MKKRVPQGKKNEKQTGKASCFQLVEKRIAHFKDSFQGFEKTKNGE